jgi:hypothetical protein
MPLFRKGIQALLVFIIVLSALESVALGIVFAVNRLRVQKG